MKRIPGIPWSPRSPLGPPGKSLARRWDPPGRPWDPQASAGIPTDNENGHASTNLQRWKFSIATSESLCGRCTLYTKNRHLFGRPQSRPGGDREFQEGWTPMGERSLPIEPQGQAPLYIWVIYMSMYVHIHIYIYIHMHAYRCVCVYIIHGSVSLLHDSKQSMIPEIKPC